MLRSLFIFLSRQKTIRRWMESSPAARPLTRRFIAGNTLPEAMEVCARLHQEGYLTTLDYLGESVTAMEEANLGRDHCLEALLELHRRGLPSTISVKLTQLGLDINRALCFENAHSLVQQAQKLGTVVEFDMESFACVDPTLDIVTRLHEEFHCVRAVLQAYLFRTEADIRRLNSLHLPVRLCKGAYEEPESVAYADKRAVDARYLELSQLLFKEGSYPAIASHDERMIAGALSHAKESFEFQMLYGVRRDLQRRLRDSRYRVRIYVPYGEAWYPYFMRRLAERPANVFFIARNLFRA